MSTPEFGQNQAKEAISLAREVRIPKRLIRGFPLVSRVYLTLMTALLAAADHQPVQSQIYTGNADCNISTEGSNPYVDFFIDSLGRLRRLETIPGTNGRPPNNPDNLITTIADSIGSGLPTCYQVSESIYPANARKTIAIERKYLDARFNKIYLATSIAFDSDLYTRYPRIAVIKDANNPTDYSNHFSFPVEALPQLGIFKSDVYESLAMQSDANGRYLEVRLKKYGAYKIILDEDGMYVRSELAMTRRVFLAIIGTGFSGN